MSALTSERLLDLEREGWASLCESRGGAFYGELMSPHAVMVLVNGMVLDRPTVRASLDDSPPWSRFELSDARSVPIDGSTAALVYRASAWRDGDEAPFVALMSSVYTLVDGRLRLALYQQTTVTH